MSDLSKSVPIYLVEASSEVRIPKDLPVSATQWVEATGFSANEGEICFLPDMEGDLLAVLFGLGKKPQSARSPFLTGAPAAEVACRTIPLCARRSVLE